jgi:hypothetical protein
MQHRSTSRDVDGSGSGQEPPYRITSAAISDVGISNETSPYMGLFLFLYNAAILSDFRLQEPMTSE